MNGQIKKCGPGNILLIISLLLSMGVFSYRIYSNYYQMPIDYLIFLKTARDFQDTGMLYKRVDDYTEKYGPSAAIYKFPPPFQLAFVPLAKLPREVNQLTYIKPLLIGMYILSLILLYRHLAANVLTSGKQRFYFGSLLLITACWFMPFFESIRWLLAEIPILLILIMAFVMEKKGKILAFFSGAAIAFISCIKIYPAFMAGNFLRQKNYPGLTGLISGVLIAFLASIYFFGIEEHIFYFSHILPVLLNEEITTKWINLNFEKFLFSMGIISETKGWIFATIRLIFISAFIALLIKQHKRLVNNAFLAFSFFICTMFFCFPNYWPQYQIYLLIPIAYLIASYLKNQEKPAWAAILGIGVIPLFFPDNLWNNPPVLKIPIMSLISLIFYEARSLSTITLWLLTAREILMLKKLP